MGTWMSFMWPLIVMNTHEKFTLPIGLAYFQSLHGKLTVVLVEPISKFPTTATEAILAQGAAR